MRIFNLLTIAFFLTINLYSQESTPLLQKVQAVQTELNREFKLVENVFISNERISPPTDKFRDNEELSYFNYNKNMYSQLRNNTDGAIALKVPYQYIDGSDLILDLVEAPDSFYDFTVTSKNGEKISGHDLGGVHFRGVVRGRELSSLVAISIFKNEISGIISITGRGTINIGRIGKEEQHIMYNDANINSSILEEEICETPEDGMENLDLDDLYGDVLDGGGAGDPIVNCLKVYFEIDHDIYNFLNASITNTSNFVAGIFNEVATIFLNESITMELSEVFVWDTPDNYSNSSSTGLNQFVSNTNGTFNGDLAHLLTYRSGNSNPNNVSNAGGRANNFGGVCVTGNSNLSPHSYTSVYPDFVLYPVFSRQVKVITHEIGHNLGSRHTHACVWNENNTAIDGCSGSTEGSCALPATIPDNTGTIMSYCDRNAGIDFTLGFGPQPGNLIRSFVSNLTCIGECTPSSCELSTNISSINLDETSSTNSFSVFSDGSWTVSNNASWINLNTTSGTGNGSVSFTVEANPIFSSRTSIITIVCDGTPVNVFVFQTTPSSPPCRLDDSLALVALYNATGGPNWTVSWDLNDRVEQWNGVGLNVETGCVESVNMGANNLVGNIPPEIEHITNLWRLSLPNNKLSGPLPAEIGNLSALRWLQLQFNQISGSIPSQIANLSELSVLSLFSNQFSGSIPPALGSLSKIEQLLLNKNQLSGSIPLELGNLINLRDFRLGDNQLTGTLPVELGNLTSLTSIEILNNQLSGNIPEELASLPNLKKIFSSNNEFTGGIPAVLGNSTKLTTLWLDNNQLSECFDQNLLSLCDQLTSTKITLGNNFTTTWEDFCTTGQCNSDPGCRFLDSLVLVSLYNSTDGPNWTNPWDLNQPLDQWNGIGLDGVTGCVEYITLASNNLTGSLPADIGNLSELWRLNLAANQLSGPLPLQIGNLSNLQWLQLQNNQFSGSIPSQLANLNAVTIFWLFNNQFSGSIPSALGNLNSVQQLILNGNQLTGSLPAALGNLTTLSDLRISDNQLSGTLPVEFGNLTSLTSIEMSNNQLSGSIPAEFAGLPNLRKIFSVNNLFSGSLPAELGNSTKLITIWLENNQLSGCFDQNLSSLCGQLTSTKITNGNSFDASWEDFCNGGAGSCSSSPIVTDFPYNEGFENGLGLWTQDQSDDMDWTRFSGSTPTSGTGPTGAAEGTFFMYTEATNNSNKSANLISPRFDLSQVNNPVLAFKLHVFGSNLESLVIDISTDDGASWINLIGIYMNGWGGINAWLTATLPTILANYSSDIVSLRFVGTTGNGSSSDIAVDDIIILSDSNADDLCPESLSINGPTLFNSNFQASQNVSADGFVLTGSQLNLRSGNSIDLLPGFEVENGAVFHAIIGVCE